MYLGRYDVVDFQDGCISVHQEAVLARSNRSAGAILVLRGPVTQTPGPRPFATVTGFLGEGFPVFAGR